MRLSDFLHAFLCVFFNGHPSVDGIECISAACDKWLNLPWYACDVTAGLRLEAISNPNYSVATVAVMLQR